MVDGTVLPAHPFDPAAPALMANVPLLIGNMRDEAAFFERDHPEFFHMDAAALTARVQQAFGPDAERILATYRQTRSDATPVEQGIAIETALSMGAGTATLADRKAAQPAPVYRYRNDFQSNIPIKGTDWTLRAGHAIDISITFLNTEMPDLQGDGPGLVETAKAVSGYFTSFARSGVPSAAGQPAWPRYDTKNRAVMLLNSQCQVAMDPDGQEREMWQALGV
ncbi:carboxylesterase type B [Nitrospirillum viridazoti Y2]|nr:carboxylesterase type B [Nitrospirillum amazonense Y2]